MSARANTLPVAALAALLASAACTSFEDVTTVLDLRVLAVTTEPSEIVLTITGLPTDPAAPIDPAALAIDPASIPKVIVTPLIVDPREGIPAPTFALAACPNDPYGAGPPMNMGGGGPDPSGGARSSVGSTVCPAPGPGVPTWSFGDGHAAATPVDVQLTPEQLLAAFKADVYVDQYGQVHGGFDLGMPLNLQLTVSNGVDTLVAIKRVLFWATMLPGQVPNHAPTIPLIESYRERDEKTWDPIGPITPVDDDVLRVPLGTKLWLRPQLPPADVESYVTTVISRDPPHRAVPTTVERERIRYAYYATAGHFDPARTVSELVPGVSGTVHLESRYVPPATLDDVPVDAMTGERLATVWIVVRDDRGGESWVTRRIALDPAP